MLTKYHRLRWWHKPPGPSSIPRTNSTVGVDQIHTAAACRPKIQGGRARRLTQPAVCSLTALANLPPPARVEESAGSINKKLLASAGVICFLTHILTVQGLNSLSHFEPSTSSRCRTQPARARLPCFGSWHCSCRALHEATPMKLSVLPGLLLTAFLAATAAVPVAAVAYAIRKRDVVPALMVLGPLFASRHVALLQTIYWWVKEVHTSQYVQDTGALLGDTQRRPPIRIRACSGLIVLVLAVMW